MQENEVNVKSIAAAAQVSPSTASIVLNGKAAQYRISEKTSERVLRAADALDYKLPAARRTSKRNFASQLICVFCPPDFSKGPVISFFKGAERCIQERKLSFELLLFPYHTGELACKQPWLTKEFMAGAVMLALGEADISFLERNSFDIPIILYNRTATGYCSILTDDFAVGFSAMSHFIQRGHRRFALIAPDRASRACTLRIAGFQNRFDSSAYAETGGQFLPVLYGEESDTGGYDAMTALIGQYGAPCSVFLPSDNMLSGVMRCILEKGHLIPDDFELISYGNSQINTILTPSVTSFAPPNEEMSYNCVKLLARYIEEGVSAETMKLSYEAQLYFRESSPEK